MKVRCQTRALQDAVQLATSVVGNNSARPILLALHVRADSNGLRIQGTDIELGLSVQVDECIVEKEGEWAIPASRFHAILREMPSDEVELSADASGVISVRSDRSLFKVPSEETEEFPVLEFANTSEPLVCDRTRLIDSLRRVTVAAAKDATRFQMHSVLLHPTASGLRLVSTDGKRLALANVPLENLPEKLEAEQFILPLKGVDLLMKVLGSVEEDQVEISLDPTQLTYPSDRVSLSCRLVEGRYPDYERALPSEGQRIYDVSVEAFQVALRQAALMTTKETNSVTFEFDNADLVLSTRAAALGESRIEVPVERVASPDESFTVNFNPTYLLDLLKAVGTPMVRMAFVDRKTAGSFTIPGDDDAYRHIVMPLVTQD